jgi:hypothetical protein
MSPSMARLPCQASPSMFGPGPCHARDGPKSCRAMGSPIGPVRKDMYSQEPYAAAGASMLCMGGLVRACLNFHLFL